MDCEFGYAVVVLIEHMSIYIYIQLMLAFAVRPEVLVNSDRGWAFYPCALALCSLSAL